MSQVVSILAVAAGVLVCGEKDHTTESLRHDKYQLAEEIACICFITSWAVPRVIPIRLYFGARRRITSVLKKAVACSFATLLVSGALCMGKISVTKVMDFPYHWPSLPLAIITIGYHDHWPSLPLAILTSGYP